MLGLLKITGHEPNPDAQLVRRAARLVDKGLGTYTCSALAALEASNNLFDQWEAFNTDRLLFWKLKPDWWYGVLTHENKKARVKALLAFAEHLETT